MKIVFHGSQEHDSAPILLIGEHVLEQVDDINNVFGKTRKKEKSKTSIWKKRSILFNLSYWSDLDVRHCIDVLHIEKNFCDSVIDTLLNIQGKTKDALNTCQDLVEMDIRD